VPQEEFMRCWGANSRAEAKDDEDSDSSLQED
jgi:hypothetical protein